MKSCFGDRMDRRSNAAQETGKQGGKAFVIRRRCEYNARLVLASRVSVDCQGSSCERATGTSQMENVGSKEPSRFNRPAKSACP